MGSNLLASIDGPLTIELWATQLTVQTWGRIFELGNADRDYVAMTWTRVEAIDSDRVEAIDSDRVEWRYNNVAVQTDDTNAPYTLGVEFHIVMTIDPTGGSGARVEMRA